MKKITKKMKKSQKNLKTASVVRNLVTHFLFL